MFYYLVLVINSLFWINCKGYINTYNKFKVYKRSSLVLNAIGRNLKHKVEGDEEISYDFYECSDELFTLRASRRGPDLRPEA